MCDTASDGFDTNYIGLETALNRLRTELELTEAG